MAWIVTPDARSAPSTGGSRRSAAAACTSTVSAALHTLGRCTLALRTMPTASSSSADSSRNTCTADPGAGLDYGHRRLRDDGVDELGTAPRDEDVDEAARPHEFPRAVPAELIDGLHRQSRQPDGFDRGLDEVDQYPVRVLGGAPPAQHDGVPALQRQCSEIDSDVRPSLVDDTDDTERDTDLADPQSVRQGRAAHRLPDRVDECGDWRTASASPSSLPVSRRRRSCRATLSPFSLPFARSRSFASTMRDAPLSMARAIASSASFFCCAVAVARAREASRAASSVSWTEVATVAVSGMTGF